MKKSFKMAAVALMVSLAAVSCKKKVSDADLTTRATTVVTTYPGTSVEVKDGTAHLSGTFATEADKAAAIDALRKVEGVKDVMDMATVTPVAPPVTTTSAVDPAVQQRVADAVKDFPSVNVETVNGELTLTGNVSPEQARKIKMSVDALKVGKVNYNYTVK